MNVQGLKASLRLPVVCAPMFLVSGPDLLIAASRVGVLGSLPASNARNSEELAGWLERIEQELESGQGKGRLPYALNIIVRGAGSPRFVTDMELVERFRPPVVITSVGKPGEVVARVHAYGGLVFHDVANQRHAEKAIAEGVDGLILLTAGAGGHTGTANPFAFVSTIRRIWSGAILLAGGIGDGRSIRAVEVLGADFAYMGTRFAATRESLAVPAYKALLVSQGMADVVTTDRVSGMLATFMAGSIRQTGLDPEDLPLRKGLLQPDLPDHIKAWRDVWSAGHGVGLIDDIPTVSALVERLEQEYRAAGA